MKFTFKTEKAKGSYRSFFPDTHQIKLNKIMVGNILNDPPHHIRLMVFKDDINEDGNPNCSWRWVELRKDFESVKDAKIFLNNHYLAIMDKYNIHFND